MRAAELTLVPNAEVLFVINDHDRTVKSAPVLDLAALWRRRAVPVSVYALSDSLDLPHNLLDPSNGAATSTVPTLLLSLVREAEAPRWIPRR